MSTLHRLANLLHRSRLDREIDAELRAHIDLRTEAHIAAGVDPAEARRKALVQFGSRAATQERVAAVDSFLFFASVGSDLRGGLRQLVKNPGFALTAILSLGLGIGVTVAVFSVIYGVLLHPFPYAQVDRLANLSITDSTGQLFDAGFTGRQIQDLRNVPALEGLATWFPQQRAVTDSDMPETVTTFLGIGDTFPVLGVPPLLGRNLGPSDSPAGQAPLPVVELHYRFWQRHFHGDPNIVGKVLVLNHRQYTIVGVTRPHFTWGWGADVYLPASEMQPGGVVVKLCPGVSLASADAELQPLLERFAREMPHTFPDNFRVEIRPLTYEVRRNMGGTLYLLFGAVLMLLAIGSSNVSILLLARGAARRHEFALRSAVGASGQRIVRQLLTESLLLAVTGTALGIAIAYQLLRLLVAWLPVNLFPPDVTMQVNLPALLFAATLALLSSVFFGLAPALQLAKPEIVQAMQSGSSRTAGSVRGKRLHSTLVGVQIALTLVLLTAAGAAGQGFLHLLRVPLGYDPHNVLSIHISLPENTYTTWAARSNYFGQLRDSLTTLPEVASSSIASNATPPNSGWEQRFDLMGQATASPASQTARVQLVDQNYFDTLRVPLLQGRIWTPTEVASGAALAIVNQAFARHYAARRRVLGRAVRLSEFQGKLDNTLSASNASGWIQIIGIVGDTLNNGLDQPIHPAIFVPYNLALRTGTQLLVRTRVAPDVAFGSIRRQLAAAGYGQQSFGPINDLESWIRNEPAWSRGRLISGLFAGFSIAGLFLSAVGLYSVLSYSVVQRTNEFGIRMALGASRSQVLQAALTSAATSVGIGIAVGLALSLSLSRVVADWAGMATNHPALIGGMTVLLLAVGAAACLVPARRVLSIDPMAALRSE
jgi:putative ABC transport system permease protein